MQLSEFATLVTRATYFLIAVITLVDYLAHRDETRLDTALMFLAFGITVVLQEYTALTRVENIWLSRAQSVAAVAQPVLLIRLVAHFRPVPRRVQQAAVIGFLASTVLLLLFTVPLPVLAVVLIVVYFAWAEAYAALAFVRGAMTTGGVTRSRHFLAALGSGLVAAVILAAGVLSALPALQGLSQPVTQLMSVTSALAFYFAFAPPRWLRQTWQFAELHRFLRASAGKPAGERATQVLPFLCTTALRAVGGRAAAAAMWSEADQQLMIAASTHPSIQSGTISAVDGATGRAWRERRGAVARSPAEFSAEGKRLSASLGAQALIAVPIATVERAWGVLVVLLQRGPLFPDDDLDLLMLFTEQSALALEQQALLTEQQSLVEHLRDRTAQLEAANKELEAFSYSVSHDLRAPLRHIEGFTDLLLRNGASGERQHQHLVRISEAAVRMARLIDDLLTFSRMGRAELRSVPVSLDRLVTDVQRELQGEANGRTVVWNVGPLPVVRGDPELLRLAWVNLLSNAIKYTRGRDPATIDIGVESASAKEAVIFVRDNGVGFDMQYVDKLFGVFQRLHHADEFEGIGIGLANVRRIVNRHGGRTWAIGVPGQGATFYMALPLAPAELIEPAAAARASAQGQPS